VKKAVASRKSISKMMKNHIKDDSVVDTQHLNEVSACNIIPAPVADEANSPALDTAELNVSQKAALFTSRMVKDETESNMKRVSL
jgi:hypothetical protein